MNVTVESARGAVTVRCQGRLVRGQETALLCAVIHQDGPDIILDLSGVTAIDGAGIGALVSLQAAGTYLRLAGPSLAVHQELRLTNLDSVFEISELSVTMPEPSAQVNREWPSHESSGYVARDA